MYQLHPVMRLVWVVIVKPGMLLERKFNLYSLDLFTRIFARDRQRRLKGRAAIGG